MSEKQKRIDQFYEEFIYKRTYSRWLPEKGRREEWKETVERYHDFIESRVPDKLKAEFRKACDMIYEKKIMPSMRALWSAGKAAEMSNIAMYNCSAIPMNNQRAFSELLFILLNGTGVGISVERQFTSQLPAIPPHMVRSDSKFVVPDSKQGWAEAYAYLIDNLYEGKIPTFDYSLVRPMGAELKTSGGRSSGPEPLKDLFNFTTQIFTQACGRKLHSIEVHDICCYVANVVVVGGVRRSAILSLSNPSDERMAKAKMGNFYDTYPWRMLANNSACYTEKPDVEKFLHDWMTLVQSKSGERGIVNREAFKQKCKNIKRDPNYDFLVNPCQPAYATVLTPEGIKTFADIDVGSTIWSEDGWVEVTKKWSSGVQPVYSYNTTFGSFVGTKEHRVVENGVKVEAQYAKGIDVLHQPNEKKHNIVTTAEIDSVRYLEDCEVFHITVNGEHHTYWTGGLNVSNCAEIVLRPYGFCNLSESLIRPHNTLDELKEQAKYATLLGVLQSTYTDFPFLNPEWKKNAEEERLLGVSLSGLRDHPILNEVSVDAVFWIKEMKRIVDKYAIEYANDLGINIPTATTAIKPSGTSSQLNSVSSGLHTRLFDKYIKRIRVSTHDPICKLLMAQGVPSNPEVGQDEDTCSTRVFEFPMKSPNNAILSDDVNALDQLEYWKMLQVHWCDGNPSCTVYVKDHEWIQVANWVYENWDYIGGLSFLPYTGSVYKLMPYENTDEETYEKLVKEFPENLSFDNLQAFESKDLTEGATELACVGGACQI